ncbi:hypothetical protein Q9233_016675 [Columba guinea]|nr:hypothetical protein Q9233_016675 [Columba guinea]
MHRPPEGVEGARVTQMPSFKQLLKELRGRNAAMALHASSLDRLVESQAKEFLRKIPSKLLQNELYEDWMSALQKTSRQERLAGLKENQQSMKIQVQLAQLAFEVFQMQCHLFFVGKASLDTLSNRCPK